MINLHAHDTFSHDGFGTPEQVIAKCKELGYEAIAITNHDVVYSLPIYWDLGKKEGIKIIHGCEMRAVSDINAEPKPRKSQHITILSKNVIGYKNLMKLVTKSFTREYFYYRPRLDYNTLEKHSDGLIVLSGCPSSQLSKYILENDLIGATKFARKMKDRFSDFYLEVQAVDIEPTQILAPAIRAISKKLDIPIVLTTDVHYLEKGQHSICNILQCIRNRITYNELEFSFPETLYYMTDSEIWEQSKKVLGNYFTEKELYSMIAMQERITADCENFDIPKAGNVKSGFDEPYKILRQNTYDGLERYGLKNETYINRIEQELDLIERKGFSDYFLVVADMTNWARSEDILVGDSRGSSACSLVCYCTGITGTDPMKYDLIMERFLSEDRVDPPDIDIDVEHSKRQDVIKHVQDTFGTDRVAHLSTFVRFKGRNTLGEIGKVFGIPRNRIEEVQSVLVERGRADARCSATIEDTFLEFKAAQRVAEEYPEILNAIQLEGQVRHIGVHAAGIVIANTPLTDCIALVEKETEDGGRVNVASADGDSVYLLELLKMDILGLKNLTMLKNMMDDIDMSSEQLQLIDLEDEKVIHLFSHDPKGIFQFGAVATASMAKQLGIDKFDDVIAAIALPRPGPLHSGASQLFTEAKKNGTRKIWDLELMNDITKTTYGLIIFQEQVLRVMKEIGNMTWQDVASIRNAMSKSLGDEFFNKYREIFVNGAVAKHGTSEQYADEIFDYTSTFGCIAWNTRIMTEERYGDSVDYDLKYDIGDMDTNRELVKRIGSLELWKNIETTRCQIVDQIKYDKWKVIRHALGFENAVWAFFNLIGKNKFETIQELFHKQHRGDRITIPMVDPHTGLHKFKEPVAIVYSGKKDTYFIRTCRENAKGSVRTIRCSLEHKFLTEDGDWRQLEDLMIGNKVYVAIEYGSEDYAHYSSPVIHPEKMRQKLLKDNGDVWNKGLKARENEKVMAGFASSWDSRSHNQSINDWGYGERSIARDGHVCQSKFEAEFEEWLLDNRIDHFPHPRIKDGLRIADYLIGEYYIELDGMEPRRTDEYWDEKYNGDLSHVIIVRRGDSFDSIKDRILILSDPEPYLDDTHILEEISNISFACEEDTYDVIMPPEQPHFIADGFVTAQSWGFNKAHAVGYSLLAFYTAFFKAYHPREFYKVMCNYSDDEELKSLLREYKEHGHGEILPPKINKSGLVWEIENNDLRAGLLTVLPQSASEEIVSLYPIENLDDLENRAQRRKVNSRVIGLIDEYKLLSDEIIDPFGLYVFAERMGYVTDRTHKIGDLGYSFTSREVTIAGVLAEQINVKSIQELKESSKIKDWKLRFDENAGDAWCICYLTDETGNRMNIHVKNYMYPQVKDMLWSKKINQDILVIRGVIPGNSNYMIAKEIWEWNDQKLPNAKCYKCSLIKDTLVGTDGDVNSKLIGVGMVPGYHEEKQGKPFVGKAGQELDKILFECGINRQTICLDNAVRCFAHDEDGKNRNPTEEEIECCRESLLARIKSIPDRIVVAFGRIAYNAVTGGTEPIGQVAGSRIECDGFVCIPCLHPASLLYPGEHTAQRESIKQSLLYAKELAGL